MLRRWLGIELVEVSLREKLVSAVGGGVAILGLMLSVRWVLPDAGASGVIASMGGERSVGVRCSSRAALSAVARRRWTRHLCPPWRVVCDVD